MEVRQLLQARISLRGDISEIAKALSDLYQKHTGFNRLCIEFNPGYAVGQGCPELVGYREETEEEIKARERALAGHKKTMARKLKKKEKELDQMRREFKNKYGE